MTRTRPDMGICIASNTSVTNEEIGAGNMILVPISFTMLLTFLYFYGIMYISNEREIEVKIMGKDNSAQIIEDMMHVLFEDRKLKLDFAFDTWTGEGSSFIVADVNGNTYRVSVKLEKMGVYNYE